MATFDRLYELIGVKFRSSGRKLGRGAYATVLELEYLGLKCAGKKLHDSLLKQGDASYTIRRFEEECRLLSQVRHPNIVQFLGVYFQQGVRAPILVMEFLPTNLTSCIEQYNILPKEISYSILHDVALGLCYLHSQAPPIIHRDLSSNNVLLTPNMTAKISDLGVARILNLTPLQVSRMTQAPGTPAYMPPEVMIASPKYDTSVDEFSYGIMMIHMFSGRWPEPQVGPVHTEPDDTMIPVSEAERREVFLRAIGNDHPLMDLILKCIHNHPQARAHASEIVERLAKMVLQFPTLSVNRLREKLQKKDKEIQEKREEIQRKDKEVQEKREEIGRKDKEIQNLQVKIKCLRGVRPAPLQPPPQQQPKRVIPPHSLPVSSPAAAVGRDILPTLNVSHSFTPSPATYHDSQLGASSQNVPLQQYRQHFQQMHQQLEDGQQQLKKLKKQLGEENKVTQLMQQGLLHNHRLQRVILQLSRELQSFIQATPLTTQKQVQDQGGATAPPTPPTATKLPTEKQTSAQATPPTTQKQLQDLGGVIAPPTFITAAAAAPPPLTPAQPPANVSIIWKPCTKLTTRLNNAKTTVINGKIFCGGGETSHVQGEYSVYCYDPSIDTWITLKAVPVRYFGLGQVNGKLVTVGGRNRDEEQTNEVYTYDEQSWKWKQQTIPPMPTARQFPGVLSLQSALVVAGGFTTSCIAAVEIFKPDTLQWYKTDPLLKACKDISLVGIGNTCYALGGYNYPSHFNQALYASVGDLLGNAVPANQTTHIGSSNTQSAWRTLQDTPTHQPTAAVVTGNILAIGGGKTSEAIKKAVYMYSPFTKSWILISDLPAPRSGAAVAVLSSTEILVIGGWDGGRVNTVFKGTLHLNP